MKRFSRNTKDRLIGLMLYQLFRKPQILDAYCIAVQIGATKFDPHEIDLYDDKENGALKDWIRLGCLVNFCWLDGKGDLERITATLWESQQLRSTDRELHEKIQLLRTKSDKRFSADWKKIEPKLTAAKALRAGKPRQDSLELTWSSVQADCARKLQQMNKPKQAETLQSLSIEKSAVDFQE